MIKRLTVLVALSALGCGGGMETPLTPPPIQKKTVFLTSANYPGDLKTASGGVIGAAAGDALCTTAGMAAQLGTQWKAWLSDSKSDAIDRIDDVGPWYLPSGEKVFNNKANLATTALIAITEDENGAPVLSWDGANYHFAWTGTQTGGLRSEGTCDDWSTADGELWATSGEFDKPAQWTAAGSENCDSTTYLMHLYCLQQ